MPLFMKYGDVKGESTDKVHKDEIEIYSFSWGETQLGGGGGGGGGGGKVSMQDFHFTMPTNRASPQIFLDCASGRHTANAMLTVRSAGGGKDGGFEYLKYKFTDCLITSFNVGSNLMDEGYSSLAGNAPRTLETFSLNFGKIEVAYTVQKPDGRPGEVITASWDQRQNDGALAETPAIE
jgi:type VI secretion system secreted protein Hcp